MQMNPDGKIKMIEIFKFKHFLGFQRNGKKMNDYFILQNFKIK